MEDWKATPKQIEKLEQDSKKKNELIDQIAKALFNKGLEPSLPWEDYDDSFKEELYATASLAILPIIEQEKKAERHNQRLQYIWLIAQKDALERALPDSRHIDTLLRPPAIDLVEEYANCLLPKEEVV